MTKLSGFVGPWFTGPSILPSETTKLTFYSQTFKEFIFKCKSLAQKQALHPNLCHQLTQLIKLTIYIDKCNEMEVDIVCLWLLE